MIDKFNLNADIVKNLATTGAILLGAVILRLVAEFVIRSIVKRFEDDNPDDDTVLEKRMYTLSSIIKNVVNIFIVGITILTVMSQWGINIAPLLTGAGIIGLAVGFGSQALVRDVVTGFFILFENTFNIGDEITVSGTTGKVTKMNLRTTIIVGENGNEYTIPNSSISIIKKEVAIKREAAE